MAGTKLGSAFYEILPDLNKAAFVAAGVNAGAALAQGINSSLAKGLASANSTVMKTFATAGKGAGSAFSNALSGSLSTAKGAIGTMTTLASGIRAVGSAAISAGGMLAGGFWKGLNLASDATRSLGTHLGIMSFQLQIVGQMLTMLVTGPVTAAITALTKLGLTTAMNIQDATVALKALLPPGYDVEALMKRLSALAIKSPIFSIDQISQFTKQLVGAGIEIDRTEQVMESLNKIFITYGVSGEGVQKSMLGVSQVFMKGRAFGEELTGQIGEQIPIWKLLSDVTGKTQAELIQFVQDGKLTSDMFADLIIKMGDLPQVAAGAEGGVKTLRAQWVIFQETVQQQLAMEFLKHLDELSALLQEITPLALRLLKVFIDNIPRAIEVLHQLVDVAYDLEKRWNALDAATKKLAEKIAGITFVAGPALLALGGLLTVASTIIGFVSIAMNPWVVFTTAIVGGLVWMYKTSEDFRQGIEAFRVTFMKTFGQELPSIMSNLVAIGDTVGKAFMRLIVAFGFETWVEFGTYLGETLPRLISKGLEEVRKTIDRVANAVIFLRQQWELLDEPTQKLILKWGSLAAAAIVFLPLLTSIGSFIAVLGANIKLLLNPWGVAVAAIVAGFIYMYKTSEEFRRQIDNFTTTFRQQFAEVMPAAIDHLLASLRELAAAIIGMLPPSVIDAFHEWGTYLGYNLPRLIAAGINLIADAISFLARTITFLKDKWDSLDDTTKKHIEHLAAWAAAAVVLAPVLVPISNALGFILLSLTKIVTPWTVFIAAVVGGFYVLYKNFGEFQHQIDTFVGTFISNWGVVMPGAFDHMMSALGHLADAVLRVLGYFGLSSWHDFGGWAAGTLLKFLAFAVNTLATAIDLLAHAAQFLMDQWDRLTPATQATIIKIAEWGAAALLALVATNKLFGVIGGLTSNLGLFKTQFFLVTAAVVGGFALMREFSEVARYEIDTFVASFIAGFRSNVLPAIHNVIEALHPLADAILRLLGYFGLQSWMDFGGWAGGVITKALAFAINLIADAIERVAAAAQFLMDKWDSLTPSTQALIIKVVEWGAAIVAATIAANKLVGIIGGLTANLGFLKTGFGIASLAIVGGFILLYKHVEDFRIQVDAFIAYFMNGFKNQIKPAVDNLVLAFHPLADVILRILGYFGLDEWSSFGGWAGAGLAELIANAINLVANAVFWLSAKISGLLDIWDGLSPRTKQMILDFGQTLLMVGAAVIAFEKLHGAMKALSLLMGGPWGIAIAGVAVGLIFLYQHSETFRGAVDAFKESFRSAFGEQAPGAIQRLKDAVNNNLIPAFKALAASLGFNTFEEFGTWLGEKFAQAAVLAIDGLTWAVNKLADAFQYLAEKMPVIKQHLEEAKGIVDSLKEKWDGLSESQQHIIEGLMGGAGLGALAVAKVPGVGAAAGAVASGAGQGIVGALAAIGPAGWIAVASIVGFTTATKEGRDMAKSFVKEVWEGFQEKILPALKELWKVITEQLIPAWTEVLHALGFEDWKEFGKFLGEVLVTVIWVVIKAITIWAEVVAAIVRAIAEAINALKEFWNWLTAVDSKVWDFIKGAGKEIGHFFSELYHDIVGGLKNTWDHVQQFFWNILHAFKLWIREEMSKAVGEAFQNACDQAGEIFSRWWENIKQNAHDAMYFIHDTVVNALKYAFAIVWWILDNVIIPFLQKVWENVTSFSGVWFWFRDHVISPVWDWIEDRIRNAVEYIHRIWDWLKEKMKEPINVVIGFINNGIIDPWNWIAHNVPFTPKMNRIPTLAQGGYVSGPGTALSDSINARLSNGEFVVNARATKIYRDLLEAVNRGGSPDQIIPALLSADNSMGYRSASTNAWAKYLMTSQLLNRSGLGSAQTTMINNELERTLDQIRSVDPHIVKATPPNTADLATLGAQQASNKVTNQGQTLQQGDEVTLNVYIGDELIVKKVKAVIDANNQATIRAYQSGYQAR